MSDQKTHADKLQDLLNEAGVHPYYRADLDRALRAEAENTALLARLSGVELALAQARAHAEAGWRDAGAAARVGQSYRDRFDESLAHVGRLEEALRTYMAKLEKALLERDEYLDALKKTREQLQSLCPHGVTFDCSPPACAACGKTLDEEQ